MEEVELLDVEKERRNAMRLLLECWPASCAVSNQNLSVAYRRYRSKRDTEAATTAPDAETAGGSADNKMTSQVQQNAKLRQFERKAIMILLDFRISQSLHFLFVFPINQSINIIEERLMFCENSFTHI